MGPDYDLEPGRDVSSPEELKAIGDETRQTILSLLGQQAATTSQLAATLDRPKGTVGHHLKVLESAGLVRVVRTRKVRALTEKYYGRTARTFHIRGPIDGRHRLAFVEQALQEARPDPGFGTGFTLRHAQIPEARVADFLAKLVAVAEEFASAPPEGGDSVFGLLAGIYPTDRRVIGAKDRE